MRKAIAAIATCVVLCLLLTASDIERNKVCIIPIPVSVRAGNRYFELTREAKISFTGGADANENALIFSELLNRSTGYHLIVEQGNSGAIQFIIDNSRQWKPEEYKIKVTKNNIVVSSGSSAGLFMGIQTLRQLFPKEIESPVPVTEPVKWQAPCVEIKDYPRFQWRGMMLDVCRHFYDVEFIKKYIDLLAMNKMNVFHWHLTDDQGWRIEIKKYPKLTEVGAWRVNKETLPWSNRERQKPGEVADFGGFYTQEQIKEVVEYAAKRHITVVPEIEMPAHVSSALAAYPQYSCTGGPFTVPTGGVWPITDIYCAGKDSTFTFIEDILTEVMQLFPSEYIHIGGDEANKKEWKACPYCQARIKAEGLKNEEELQGYFTRRIENFLTAHGRKMIGWDEIMEGGISDNAAVMSWRGFDSGIKAAKSGHKVVMTPTSCCYFDYYQGDPAAEPKAIGGYVPVKKVYMFEPAPSQLTSREAKNILGAQGNLWTEFVPVSSHVEYMVMTRMTALSEVLWSPRKARNWNDFYDRLQIRKQRFETMGVNYAKGSYKIEILPVSKKNKKSTVVTLSGEQPYCILRYTKDGSDPTVSSGIYKKPFVLKKEAVVKAAYFSADTLCSRIYEKKVTIE
jgi:hexosaminidase